MIPRRKTLCGVFDAQADPQGGVFAVVVPGQSGIGRLVCGTAARSRRRPAGSPPSAGLENRCRSPASACRPAGTGRSHSPRRSAKLPRKNDPRSDVVPVAETARNADDLKLIQQAPVAPASGTDGRARACRRTSRRRTPSRRRSSFPAPAGRKLVAKPCRETVSPVMHLSMTFRWAANQIPRLPAAEQYCTANCACNRQPLASDTIHRSIWTKHQRALVASGPACGSRERLNWPRRTRSTPKWPRSPPWDRRGSGSAEARQACRELATLGPGGSARGCCRRWTRRISSPPTGTEPPTSGSSPGSWPVRVRLSRSTRSRPACATRRRQGRARRLALDLLDRIDPSFKPALLPTLSDDPEFRDDAVSLVLKRGDAFEVAGERPAAKQAYESAFQHARNADQVTTAARKLEAAG